MEGSRERTSGRRKALGRGPLGWKALGRGPLGWIQKGYGMPLDYPPPPVLIRQTFYLHHCLQLMLPVLLEHFTIEQRRQEVVRPGLWMGENSRLRVNFSSSKKQQACKVESVVAKQRGHG